MNEELRLIGGAVNGPAWLPADDIAKCHTYRDAVRLSWACRRSKNMTMRTLAELGGTYPSHITDYLHEDDAPTRRDLPAKHLNDWAAVVGNLGVQQWLACDARLNFMEEVIAKRVA